MKTAMPEAKGNKPEFIITIDTEGDNLWAEPKQVTTANASFLPRFQALCERYGLLPTWLTNYEMGCCEPFCEFADDVLANGTGEVGMHLHAWDTPPLSAADPRGQSYLIEFPPAVMRDKIARMTELLEDRFNRKMLSHRAGRWAFNETYARLLAEFGYRVDSSVTPHVSWVDVPGDPLGSGGTDYQDFPVKPYEMDLDDIRHPGNSGLLEVPISITKRGNRVCWLRPGTDNLSDMLQLLQQALTECWPCVVFMLHSSELMPGGSPTFATGDSIERLYQNLEALFSRAQVDFEGATLTGLYQRLVATGSTPEIAEIAGIGRNEPSRPS